MHTEEKFKDYCSLKGKMMPDDIICDVARKREQRSHLSIPTSHLVTETHEDTRAGVGDQR